MHAGLLVSTILLAVTLSAACVSRSSTQPAMSTQGSTVVRTAQVTDVRDVTVRGGRPSGLGSVVGAVLGGVAGGKIGSGHGSTAASIGGAIAGGMAGQHLEQSGTGTSTTELTVRFENGDIRAYRVEPSENFRIGDTVKVMTGSDGIRITASRPSR